MIDSSNFQINLAWSESEFEDSLVHEKYMINIPSLNAATTVSLKSKYQNLKKQVDHSSVRHTKQQ